MANKLFVGGLSWNTNDDTLRRAFEGHGVVTEAKVITDRETGRSRGFGFVTMQDPKAIAPAITAMDGTTLDGRSIRVNEAQERTSAPRRDDGGGRGRW
jgi:RNA recognition motif-containing protein